VPNSVVRQLSTSTYYRPNAYQISSDNLRRVNGCSQTARMAVGLL